MQAVKQTEGFRNLGQDAQDLVGRLDRDQNRLREDLKDHTERISHGQGHTNELIAREHERTRKTILASLQSNPADRPLHKLQASPKAREYQLKKNQLICSVLLESLRFPTIAKRYDEIEPAHLETFRWIFRSPDLEQARWSDFSLWLSKGCGIYWVNGKPASGKSTLMRFVCDDPRTAKLLNDWAHPHKLVVSTHFFWNSGTMEQRSYTGLLRGLLFKILCQCQDLIRQVFPIQWTELQDLSLKMIEEAKIEYWTLPRLTKAFELLLQEAGESTRFCLFVDGLDEFDGDPLDIIKLFTRISKLPNVKMCLSSRTLYDFVKAFRSSPTLRLQDLTFNDIKKYVDDELGVNNHMKELQLREPEEAPKLVLELVDKAAGVFLWVRLVVCSLLRGLRNSDNIFDLQKRLRLLPPSLDDLFRHILDRIDPVYLEQSSRIFQILAASRLTEDSLTSLELSFAEEPDARNLLLSPVEPISETEMASRIELVDIWLLTRCGSLIETHNSSKLYGVDQDLSYLHRTVRDFLEQPKIWSRILSPIRGSDFNPHVSLLQSGVLFITKFALPPTLDFTREQIAAKILIHAYQAELETSQAEVFLLEKLDRVMKNSKDSPWPLRSGPVFLKSNESQEDFLPLAIRCGLYHYVAHKLKCQPDVVRTKNGRPLIRYALGDGDLVGAHRLSSKIVNLLLQNGSCPNQVYGGCSTWHIVRLMYCDDRLRRNTDQERCELLKVVRSFLQNGVVVNWDVYDGLVWSFQRGFPEEIKELQVIMMSMGSLTEENGHTTSRRRQFLSLSRQQRIGSP
jgi:hypothetical protein